MPTAREYLRKKRKKEKDRDQIDNDDYKKKLLRHRVRIAILFVVSAAIIIGGSYGIYILMQGRIYNTYKTVNSTERTDANSNHYIAFEGNLLKYSRDGASYVDAKNSAIWNQTYEMQEPVVDICDQVAVIAERNGNDIYIFNQSGLMGEVHTDLTIRDARASSAGYVTAVLEDGDITYINIYDTGGEIVASNKTVMKNSGYPLSVDVSADGVKMVVSYLDVSGGNINTKIAFYNFGSVGQNEVDNLVSSYSYDGVVVPQVEFITEDIAVAFGTTRVILYEGSQIPKELENGKIKVEDEIQKVFYDKKYFGWVYEKDGGNHLSVYNTKGDRVLNIEVPGIYDQVEMTANQIIFYNEQSCIIYTLGGIKKLETTFDKTVSYIAPSGKWNQYVLITANSIDQIKLAKEK